MEGKEDLSSLSPLSPLILFSKQETVINHACRQNDSKQGELKAVAVTSVLHIKRVSCHRLLLVRTSRQLGLVTR